MRSQEDPRINSHYRKAVDNKAKGNHECKKQLIFMDMTEHQILSDECWCNRKTRCAQAGKEKHKCHPWMLISIPMKLVQVNVPLLKF